jgi:hypothetical protein
MKEGTINRAYIITFGSWRYANYGLNKKFPSGKVPGDDADVREIFYSLQENTLYGDCPLVQFDDWIGRVE